MMGHGRVGWDHGKSGWNQDFIIEINALKNYKQLENE